MRRSLLLLLLLLAVLGVLAVLVPLGTGAPPPKPAPAGMVLIADSTLGAAAPSFDITGIPGTYKHLQIVASLRSTRAGWDYDPVRIRFNNDSGANYQNATQYTIDGNAGAHEENSVTGGYTEAMGASSPSGSFAAITVWIPDYASTTTYKNFTSSSGGIKLSGSAHLVDAGGGWNGGGAAISRITLVPSIGPNFLAGSRVTLYGLN